VRGEGQPRPSDNNGPAVNPDLGHSAVYRLLRAITPLRRVWHVVRALFGRYRIRVWRLHGCERYSGQLLEIVFAGQLQSKNFIVQLAFGADVAEAELGPIWLWNLARRDPRYSAGADGLTIVQIAERQSHWFHRHPAFSVPCWVGGELDIDAWFDKLRRTKRGRQQLRQVQDSRATYEVVKDRGAFERFYHDMYLPYVMNVYGDHAFVMSYEELMGRFDQCELFRVKIAGECVVAQVLLYEQNRARAWSIGVKNGDRVYVKAGAIMVLDHLAHRYLREKGHNTIHLGASRPFLRDGVLRHKSHAGIRVIDDSGQTFAISCPLASSPAWTFLGNNPFIRKEGGRYWGTILATGDDPPSADEFRSLYHDLWVDGLAGLTIYASKPWRSPASIPRELQDKIRVTFTMPVHAHIN
jgi:hypothetical protein